MCSRRTCRNVAKWLFVHWVRFWAFWLCFAGARALGCRRRPRLCEYATVNRSDGSVTTLEQPVDALPPQPPGTLRVVAVADVHDRLGFVDVPRGDVFITAGDITFVNGWGRASLRAFNDHLAALPHAKKLVIAGNHDRVVEAMGPVEAQRVLSAGVYLQNSGHEWTPAVAGAGGGGGRPLRVFGVPQTARSHSDNTAFQHHAGSATLASAYAEIPGGLDILIAHNDPHASHELAAAVARAKPRLVVCGHVHGWHGVSLRGGSVVINASIASDNCWNWPTQLPIVYDLPVDPAQPLPR